ncbi:ubiquitin carboxyl-terminal hydrolase isozyme L5-like [Symsagittifera roscoffensis]|uniref:ubiquitin carboxyl-terminal hydrolase isozyme L5-like n=1 Tax=Symsagittifera roscoffensis TaxID=84072 RepID=UPI00307C5AED
MAEAGAGNWCLIESDPGVFSELIRGFGVTGVQVEEIYSLDEDSFAPLKPVLGLIFLFKIDANSDTKSEGTLVQDNRLDEMFFAKQVIQNACATQAIINLLMNAKQESLDLGDNLKTFKDFTKSFDPQTAGLAMSNQEQLREVHNSFARQQVFELEDNSGAKDEDLFHFVGYLPVNGRLYELDGLNEGPLDHGAIGEGADWLSKAREVLQKRIEKYSSSEIRFNLMAIIKDRRLKYEQEIEELKTKTSAQSSEENLIEMARLESLLEAENMKWKQYKVDNIRRRHNYIPLIVNVLQVLAEQGKLTEFYETAAKRTKELKKSETQSK